MSLSALDSLLIRIQGKIESRTRRPWFDLQRSYYYSDANGVKNVAELRKALEHFHVLLSDPEYDMLYQGFPFTNAGFNFKAFAARLYPKESNHHIIRDGRYVEECNHHPYQQQDAYYHHHQDPRSMAAYAYGSSYPHPPHTHLLDPYASSSSSYQDEAHTLPLHHPFTASRSALPSSSSPSSSSVHSAPSPLLQSTGAAIVTSDGDIHQFNETKSSSETSNYRSMSTPAKTSKQSKSVPSSSSSSVKAPSNSKKSMKKSNFVPRLTYNRAHHQRFNESEYEDYFSGHPVSQAYPSEEFKDHGGYTSSLDKPRFERKPPQDWVEVARRTNISRQYNTRTGKQTQ